MIQKTSEVKFVKNGANAVQYTLYPSVSSVVINSDNAISPSNVTCKIKKTDGNTVTFYNYNDEDVTQYSIRYLSGSNIVTYTGAITINATANKLTLFLYKGDYKIDQVDIPIVKNGEDGENGKDGNNGKDGENAVQYSLYPSSTSVAVDSNNVANPSTLTCKIKKVDGNTVSILEYNGASDYEIKYKYTEGGTPQAYTTVQVTSSIEKVIWLLYKGSTLVDRFDVPIVKDGAAGTQGTQGARMKWMDWSTTNIWLSGNNGEEWQYYTFYSEHAYMCLKSFTKTTYTKTPTQSVADNDGYFAVADEIFFAFINYLIVNKLTANQIDVNTIVTEKCVAMVNGVMKAAMNLNGDGAYQTFYPNGQVQFEIKPTEDNAVLTSYKSDGTINWYIGAGAEFQTTAIDSWQEIHLANCGTTTIDEESLDTNIKIIGSQYYKYKAVSGSTQSNYNGLVCNKTISKSDIPSAVPTSKYIPDGYYTNPGSPAFRNGHYTRAVFQYSGGYLINSTIYTLTYDPNKPI